MQLREFLETVVTGESGWFNLSYSNSDGSNWKEEWFGWPDDINSILERADKLAEDYNVYYSPYLFTQKSAIKDSAITGRTIVADLDNANALTLPYKPTVLVETSPGRHQSYWVIKNKLEPDEHEMLSKRMTYSIPLCDRSGWFIGKRVRLPFTYNHKYNSGPKPVKVVQNNNKLYSSLELEALPQVSLAEKSTDNFDWIHNLPKVGPQSLLQSIRTKISSKVYAQYNHPANDRSAALWALMLSAFRAGLTKEEVYLLASNSANNKFSDLKYRGEIDLAKDVLRAEIEATKKNNTDIRSKILEIRKLAISGVEKNAFLATVVKDYLLTIGSFVNCTDGTAWFIRDDTGQPLPIVHRSGPLQTLIDVTFGINSSERESLYMVSHLITYVSELPAVGTLASVSHYDMDSNTVFVHTGKKDVLKITTDSVEIVTNGYNSIVFPWNTSNEVVTPIYQDSERTWDDILFSNAFDNVIGMTPEEAKSLLRVWFVILLLRNALVARPIMAIFGQPGCLSSRTKLSIRIGNHSARTYTIGELYTKTQDKWDISTPIRIRSVKDGIVSWRTVKQFIKSGRKETFTVTVQGHDPFRVTADHKFLTPNGYRKLSELAIGDSVIVQGDILASTGKSASWRPEVSVQYHPYARERYVGSYGPYKFITKYRAVIEARMNGMETDEFINVVHLDPERASKLTYLSPNMVIHHKDEDPFNNDLSNLEVLTKTTHDTHHGNGNIRNFGKYSGLNEITTSTIESIKLYGTEATFDVEMVDEEAPNFLVNGVVVHNSGKSTLFRRIYTLLYGRGRSLNSVTTADNFDFAVASDPLVVLDNVDTWEKWLPDRLALSAATSEIVKRKLYTNAETITLKRQALLGITAHNPKFGREDVTDRLLMILLSRLNHFTPETEIISYISANRGVMWGGVIRDVQKVLNYPMPLTGYPQFRVEDFSKFGYWVACALGVGQSFYDVMTKITDGQKSFILEEDQLLIDAIQSMIENKKYTNEFRTPGQLWLILSAIARDPLAFQKQYKNALVLGKKLWTLTDSLKRLFKVTWEVDNKRGTRVWKFEVKE